MITIIGLIGLTIILTNGLITEAFRKWLYSKNDFLGEAAECSLCIGFWMGAVYSYCYRQEPIVQDILYGAMIAVLAYLIDFVLDNLRAKNELLWWESSQTKSTSGEEDDSK